ncbi:hypothetical protein LY11_02221 [Pedobacter cryoconitis]|uniref:Uncharacterized protein n=2 Tax=Pedobacter cryoconitis TaxID=188932 RepID=A0A327SS20_9SPHI|nr:hypothetical protein LY11_02221 [Pedobacter cryoconitis]
MIIVFKDNSMRRISDKRNVTPEQAIELLAEHGTKVTKEEAILILDFMYKFCILAVNQLVTNDKIKK